MSIHQLLEVGDKQAIIEWFRNKDKQEAAAAAKAAAPTTTVNNTYNITQPAANTTLNSSEQAAQGKWYDHAKCCCSKIIAQMRITDWLLLAIALLLFFQLIKKK